MLAPLKLGKFSVIFLVLLPTMALMLIFIYQDYVSTLTKMHHVTYTRFLNTTEKQFYQLAEYLQHEDAASKHQELLSVLLSETLTAITLFHKEGEQFHPMMSAPNSVEAPQSQHIHNELLQSCMTQQRTLFTKEGKEYLVVPIVHNADVTLVFLARISNKPLQQVEAIINPLNKLSFTITLLLMALLVIAYIRLFVLYRQRNDGMIDPTTQVFNRRYYHEVMKTLDANYYQIILLRINDFNAIKTRYDNEITDIILQSAASRILRVTRRQDIFLHFEDATFIVFYKRKKDEKADILAARIIESISKQPIIAEGLYINIDLQVVINRHPEEKKTLHEAIAEAQEELEQIEKNSLSSAEQGNFNSSKRSRIIFELQEALKEKYVMPMFQPIYSVETMTIHSYELFARIVTPQQEVVRANHFIDLIVDDSVAIELDIFMFDHAIAFIKKHHVILHLNIHLNTLCHETFQTHIQHALEHSPAVAPYLCIEVNGFSRYTLFSKEKIKTCLDLLRASHIDIALDNIDMETIDLKEIVYFGPDILKLDYITVNNDTYKLIQLSKNMNIKVVVKTIQSENELLYAQQSGATFVQGYFLDEPSFSIKDD
ncbi:MAG: hypothetical protein DSZ03_00435 [Sulfurimonas sp.]|nr:MAG: hypothetical protein DSZ03_00435 [Sulfurimonas sp.]